MDARRPDPRRASRPRRGRGRPGRPERLALGPPRRVGRPADGSRSTSSPSAARPPPSAGRELVIGRHPVHEALRAGRRLYRIMLAEGAHGPLPTDVLRLAVERSVPVHKVPRERLDALADHHQGLVAEAVPYSYADFAEMVAACRAAPVERPPLLLAVHALQDPQNFGNLLRTGLAVGIDGVVLPERRSVGATPAVGRASAGAIEHLRIARVVNLPRALRELKRSGLWIAGLDAAGSEVYDRADLTVPLVVVVGSEGSGLGRLVAETCDVLLRLPTVGPIDSLNAAVAGSIALYEALRQRRAAANL